MASTKTTYIASTFPENPLPTANFSPPAASCSGIYLTNNVYAIDNDKKCLPDKFNGASTAFYSPGTACPTGYTAQPQCSRNGGVRSITTVTCCPYRGDMTLSCVEDDMTLAGVWETQFCTWMAGPATVVDITRTDGGKVATQAVTMKNRDGVNAWGIRMVYQASDLVPQTTSAVTTTAATGTTGSGTTAAATGTGTGTTTGAGPTATGGGDGGLGIGAIIGIAVVVPVVVIAALVGLFLWWRRRKHQYAGVKPVDTTPTAPEMDGQSPMSSAYAYQHQHQHPPPVQEMTGTSVGEYYNSNHKVLTNPGAGRDHTQFKAWTEPAHVAELGTGQEPTELPADNGRR
ncbi:transmembrane alpha-helix domain-containing protein [Colletotrichum graminicola]|uniref:Transmembrane alpha-helix domain-containing protein n=1 Tax=Colletotrichum graminicola (strain M1.001 / M2 / FGSC 10212) TaxID=645133 RepID=E3QP29_COLGM|nr:transmembrane alpha-helix domain-containing protein [Colletotrichum graminicola M1.001]EFQ32617.1 transmembrane alpha-helix domain-containing protein [Colletotrichum graminicola M1.001]WDK18269.1 transmembrane alpha-helix domain-containing protein [Colletotrichum graminicola]